MNPVRCVEKYCRAYCDSENCWMSEARSSGRIGYVALDAGGRRDRDGGGARLDKSDEEDAEKRAESESVRLARAKKGGGGWTYPDASVVLPERTGCGRGRASTGMGRPCARFCTGFIECAASARGVQLMHCEARGRVPWFTTGPLISLPETLLGAAGMGRDGDGDGGGRANGSRPLLLVLVGVTGLDPAPDVRPFSPIPRFRFSCGTPGTGPASARAPSDTDRRAGPESSSMAAVRLWGGGERCGTTVVYVVARMRGGVILAGLSLLRPALPLPLLPEELECLETGESGGDAGSASVLYGEPGIGGSCGRVIAPCPAREDDEVAGDAAFWLNWSAYEERRMGIIGFAVTDDAEEAFPAAGCAARWRS